MRPYHRTIFLGVLACVLMGSAAMSLGSTAALAADDDKAGGKASAKFEVYKDRSSEFRWRLRATNTQILATSGDAYKAKRDCLQAIESVKRAAANAPVEDMVDAASAAGEHSAPADERPKAPGEQSPSNARRPAK